MGEVDTSSIEPVKAALCLFGEMSDQMKSRSHNRDDLEKEKEVEDMLKDYATVKVQLEAKDLAYKQTLLSLNHYQKTAEELSSLLKISEFEKEEYASECNEAKIHIQVLESRIKEMVDRLSETVKIRHQFSCVKDELEATRAGLFDIETELALAGEAKLEAIREAELLENALNMEKGKTNELLRHVSGLNEAILHSNLAAIEAEKEKCSCLSEKEAELESVVDEVVKGKEQLECMRKQLEMMQNLESQLLAKSSLIDSLHLELQQTNKLKSSAEKVASDANNDLNQLNLDIQEHERRNTDQENYINLLQTELNHLKAELLNTKEDASSLSNSMKTMTGELEKFKIEMDESREREADAQVEMALLKSEVHKGRSKVAAAEAAEERAKSEKSALYLALQQLALEAEEAKNENQRLKEEAHTENIVLLLEHEKSSVESGVPDIDGFTGNEEKEEKPVIMLPFQGSSTKHCSTKLRRPIKFWFQSLKI